MSAMCVFAPKSTMFEMVEATEELTIVMSSTPRKLNTALMMIAGRMLMLRVVTAVAMAFGASVQPLTKMTPRVSRTVTARIGFVMTWPTKWASDTSTYISLADGARRHAVTQQYYFTVSLQRIDAWRENYLRNREATCIQQCCKLRECSTG